VFVCECICVCVCVCVRRGHFAQCLSFTGCLHLFCIQALVNVPVRHVSMRRNLPDVARQQKKRRTPSTLLFDGVGKKNGVRAVRAEREARKAIEMNSYLTLTDYFVAF